MKSNVGKVDKIIRIVLGVVIAAAGIYFKSWWGLLSIVPLATAFMGTCGIYSLLGLSTCSLKEAKK